MPLYEYECTACRKHTEKIQKFSDPEITACPSCAGRLERVISAPAISFKGGGWYADGYGNAKPKGSGDGASSTGETKSGGDSKPGGETKPGSESKSGGEAKSGSGGSAPSTPAVNTPAATPAAAASEKN